MSFSSISYQKSAIAVASSALPVRLGVLYLVFTCACIVCNQGAAKVLIFPVVQQFTEAFVQALQMPDGPTSDSGFKMEVLKVSHLGLIEWRKN